MRITSISSDMVLSIILAYISVVLISLWPSILEIVSNGTWLLSDMVANVWRAMWKVIGYARKNMQVKFERKSFEMNDVSVFCQVGKMQTATEY